MNKEILIKKGKLDDARSLANSILRRSLDATDYRVDVEMRGHGARTVLTDTEFGSLRGAIQYAMNNSDSKYFRLYRITGNRNPSVGGAPYVYYYIYFL